MAGRTFHGRRPWPYIGLWINWERLPTVKIVIAPDSFKDCLSAPDVAEAIRSGLEHHLARADLVALPVADGGEGTLDAILSSSHGLSLVYEVEDALGRPTRARLGWISETRTALIEVAEAIGLQALAPHERDATRARSYGVGQLIGHALDRGAEQLIIGLGGSATNDAGAGALVALGARLLDKDGVPLSGSGDSLARLDRIDLHDLDARLAKVAIRVACDVTNPLCGPNGASAVFGPQKGATDADVIALDAALRRFAQCVHDGTGRDLLALAGGGAAGGLSAMLAGVLGGRLESGIDLVLDVVNFDEALTGADWVITGEGRIDSQTAQGKTIAGIARRARRFGVPVIALGGSIQGDLTALYEMGVTAVFPIVPGPVSLEQALGKAGDNLLRTGLNLGALLSR